MNQITLDKTQMEGIKSGLEMAGERQPIRHDVYARDVQLLMDKLTNAIHIIERAHRLMPKDQFIRLFTDERL